MTDYRLGENIRRARQAAGISPRELADTIGKGRSTISMYETNQYEPPLSVLHAIAEATNTSLLHLLGIELSRADLLRALADHEERSNGGNHDCPVEAADCPVRGVVVGLLLAPAADEE